MAAGRHGRERALSLTLSPPTPPFSLPPAPPAIAQHTALLLRRRRRCPDSRSCHRATRSSRSCSRPRAASAPLPAPAAAPPRSSVALPLQPAPPPLLPAPPASAQRTAPPRRRWRSSRGALACRRASPAPGRACASRVCRGSRRGARLGRNVGQQQPSECKLNVHTRIRAPRHPGRAEVETNRATVR
eukprot:scaffold23644_cov56-Phaeocystis_antarctica.AAC.1